MANLVVTIVRPWSNSQTTVADGLQDDLVEFHASHFSGSALPNEALVEFWDQEQEDDGLGYYEDGTKRTLTDEQIAIFRHSEIQDLIKRCIQSKLEREEAASEDEGVEKMNSTATMVEEAVSVGTTSGTAAKSNQELFKSPSSKSKSTNRKRKRPLEESSRGKSRRDPGDFTGEGEIKTYRRMCRDMDSSKDESIVLDY
jgi:hypothetical protein